MLGERNDHSPLARPFPDPDGPDGPGAPGASQATERASLARQLARGDARAAFAFAGQGVAWLPELAALARSEAWLAPWLDAAQDVLASVAAHRDARWSGLYDGGTDLRAWLTGALTPPATYLASTPISMPMILLTQVARYHAGLRRGLNAAVTSGAVRAMTGYSQGLAAAALCAEHPVDLPVERLVDYLEAMTWHGFYAGASTRDAAPTHPDTPPMAVVIGPDTAALEAAVAQVVGRLGADAVAVAIYNDRKRHAVSGTPEGLAALRRVLEARAAREADARKAGRHGGRVLTVAWDPIATSAGFHSRLVLAGYEQMMERVAELGFTVGPFELPVYDPSSDTRLDEADAPEEALFGSIFLRPGRWQRNLLRLAAAEGVDALIDCGPEDGIARLSAGCLRGVGVDVVALTDENARERLFTAPRGPRAARWDDFAPRLARLPDGRVVVDNAFVRATGTPPIILPGMTPSTVDAPIVAAAANAGFTAELAGGGQVTDRIFDERLAELGELLEPGAHFAFNALLLDNYLWGLHLGDKRLVQRARALGHPISGVTVTAGIPPVEEAVALLDELAALGATRNAFKPGTAQQVAQVVAIARAAPGHTIFLHLEGGKAGGHHSWEDLDALLLDTYHLVRAEPNLVLCVGGGVRDEVRAVELLTGAWSERHGLPRMPVDAIFVGTIAMACLEATASPSVKQALVDAPGHEQWVSRGDAKGGVTSGQSQLNADIHYLDNAAARCGRLLDHVAGDADAIAARKAEIIAALDQTAKPYFGDLDAMTWADLLERMRALMAIGNHGRYEDGPWPDASYRQRFFDVLQRAEARLAGLAGADADLACVAPNLAALDDPAGVLAAFLDRWPAARATRVHPADAAWFVRGVCARPGKPVCFVPVIDADVRRWYKSDSLWQAQDARWDASQVLVIPGPEAVTGITRADEPVAELLGRFDRAFVEALTVAGAVPRDVDRLLPAAARATALPTGVTLAGTARTWTLTVDDADDAATWLAWVAGRCRGPLAALLEADWVAEGSRLVDNPARRLFAPVAGASLELTLGDGERLEGLRFATAAADEWAAATLTADGDVELMLAHDGGPDPTWTLRLGVTLRGAHPSFHVAPGAPDRAVAGLYARTLFADPGAPAPLFEAAEEEVEVDAARALAYRRVTGWRTAAHRPTDVATNQVFSICWPAVYRTLSCDELVGGLLRLVHLDNRVEPLAAWPIEGGDEVTVSARVTRVDDAVDRRLVTVSALVTGARGPAARMTSSFHIRGRFGDTPFAARAREQVVRRITLSSAAAAFLRDHEAVTLSVPVVAGDVLRVTADLVEDRPRRGPGRFTATGTIARTAEDGGAEDVGAISVDRAGVLAEHPLTALLSVLGADDDGVRDTPRRTLARAEIHAPSSMEPFAEIGGDLNPIHTSVLAARLAGLPRPIAHGMWTAARLHAFVVEDVAHGDASRVRDLDVRFLSPVMPGEPLALDAVRVGVEDGAAVVVATAAVTRGGARVPAATARLRLLAPPTAWVFPGQGIQQQDMGMAGYLRSPAAKRVWDRADAHTRARLGFSILRVVRENPRELTIGGERLTHAKGVLHLTQLTQVAMAVLAYAQMAELEEAGVYVEDAVLCGHSVGEYNALSAAAGVLPLEAVVAIVYQRGRVMHGLVPRDKTGDSGFRMGVIRPHYAGLDHAAAEALVAAVAERTGRFLEIVNYNVRGRQYSVTGHTDALEALAAALDARRRPGSKPPYVEVPGIDVPFHSRCLRDGVADFRAALERHLPATIDPTRLVGRYIPNLVALPFSLSTAFVRVVRDKVEGPSRDGLDAVLADWDTWRAQPEKLTRLLVVELLAWQFASPVRWITTQERMFAPVSEGGLGVRRLVEVGVGYQPTLAGMARYTLSLLGATDRVTVLNVDADRALVYAEDPDPAPVVEEVAEAEAPSAEAAPAPATIAAPAPVAAPVARATAAPTDAPLSHSEALTTLLALQARVRPDQIGAAETIEALFDGVSSRRNQVLIDLGAEFDLGTIDGAHDKPLTELAAEVARRSGTWRAPGGYLAQAHDDALRRVFGRASFGGKDVAAYLETEYGFGPGLVVATVDTLALEARGGASSRGGDLGALGEASPANKDGARKVLDDVVAALGRRRGASYGKLGGTSAGAGGGTVDAAAVKALEDRLLGKDGALFKSARALAEALGHELEADAGAYDDGGAQLALDALTAELGTDLTELVQPRFDPARHVAFVTTWAAAQRDVARVAFDRLNGRIDDDSALTEVARLAPHGAEPRVAATARWFAGQAATVGLEAFAAALEGLAGGKADATLPTLADLAAEPWADEPALRSLFGEVATAGLDLRGRTALVTGASPDSIAIAVVAHLLRGGARVVVTTTTATRERFDYYRREFERHAAPGAELHVVPCNQASFGDIDALVDWLFREETEQAGAGVRVLKPAFLPDLLVPFAAIKDYGTLDQIGSKAEGALRGMVLGTERLIGAIARRHLALGAGARCHVLLPLSPNHGAFGGDGAYAESKAALEVLLAKWRSEREAWGRATTLVGARIGWVRGTGLMAGNDAVAPRLEAATGMRTFSNDEMGLMLAALLSDAARARAEADPVVADLTGGFGAVADLKGTVDGIRAELEAEAATARGATELAKAEQAKIGAKEARPATVTPLPAWPAAPAPEADLELPWPAEVTARPEDLVVVVGFGEVSPGGSARTRFELEVGDRLSAPAVLELAWLTGLVRYEESAKGGGGWVDTDSGDVVPEGELADRYRDALRDRVGVRFVEPETTGFDPGRAPVLQTVYLERDLSFRVGSEDEARAFAAADPEGTRARYDQDADAWVVTRAAGTAIRVPREVKLTRRVGGQLPRGFELGRYGFGGEMLENIDPVAMMNLAATVESFVAAGTTPEELLSWVHPTRVATTQGAGMGGMRSLHRLYVDHLLGAERQSDILQETLINVVFAYVASSYVGSYGAMAHPVAACATAALSIEDALDKIRVGKADVVMAGGWDDLSLEGMVGFGDMNATADTDKMLAMGLEPDQMSRANDRRRRGFVEAQGGGALLLARGDVALKMGLPVYGVIAYAASFGDGINRSIPAPGIGALGAGVGGADSPLARALTALGLSADDIAVVSKHDTSTAANDPNESGIHHDLQDALGRTPGNPLMVISQKTLTGHSKGGAAAWQTIGLCQALAAGVVPKNRNLEAIDPVLERYRHLLFTNERLDPGPACPMRAGLVTSLGFGHVSALLCVTHPAAFFRAIPAAEREAWRAQAEARKQTARERWARVLLGREPLYDKRVDRRFAAADGSDAQRSEERAMLLDPGARLDVARGVFVAGGSVASTTRGGSGGGP